MQWRLLASFATSLIRLYIRVKFSKIFHFRTPGLKFCLFRLQTTILVNANISNSILISFRHLWFISEQILGIDTSYHQIRICFIKDGNTKLCVLIFLFNNWHSVCNVRTQSIYGLSCISSCLTLIICAHKNNFTMLSSER